MACGKAYLLLAGWCSFDPLLKMTLAICAPQSPSTQSSVGESRSLRSLNLKFSWFSSLRLFLKLVGSLFVLLADLVELFHVLEEVWAPLESDEKLCLLAVASTA